MARVLLRMQAWGVVLDRFGHALAGLTFAVKNTDGSAATHWSAETGGTSSTATLTTDTLGGATLSGADRWVEAGEYDVTTNGNTYRVTTSGFPGWLPINVMSPTFGAKGNGVTDDTAAVQAAINAASTGAPTNGVVDVWLPSGYQFPLGQLTPKANVRIVAYGAEILPQLGSITQGLFYWPNASNLSLFAICGGLWQGTGSETGNQLLFQCAGTNPNGASCSDVLFRDMTVNNWAVGPIYIGNPLRARVLDNVLINTGQGSTYNSINFVVRGSAARGQDLLARGNIVQGSGAAAIAYVAPANDGAGDVRMIVTDNICSGYASGNNISGAINVELDGAGAGTWNKFLIRGNHVNNPCTVISLTYGIVLGQSSPGVIGQAVIDNNTVLVSGAASTIGIETFANTDVTITNNRVLAATFPIHQSGSPFMSGNRFSSGKYAGRATLSSGTVTVNTAEIQTGDNVLLTVVSPAGTRGEIQLGTIVAGTSFVINSVQPGTASTLQGSDTSTVFWQIVH